jgi:hypothetical protein
LSENKFYVSLFFENDWLEEAGKSVNEKTVHLIALADREQQARQPL